MMSEINLYMNDSVHVVTKNHFIFYKNKMMSRSVVMFRLTH